MGAPSSMARTPSRTKPREMQRYQTLPRLDHRGEDTIPLCGDSERWLMEDFLPESGGEQAICRLRPSPENSLRRIAPDSARFIP